MISKQAKFINAKILFLLASLGFAMLFNGCSYIKNSFFIKKQPSLVRVPIANYPDFIDDMDIDGLDHAISQSLFYLKKRPNTRKFRFGEDIISAAHMIKSLEYFRDFLRTNPKPSEIKRFISKNYRVYKSTGQKKSKKVLFTGYYEPMLHGSITRSDEYKYPIYAIPKDLVTINLSLFSPKFKNQKLVGRLSSRSVVPYHDRKAIEERNVLKKKGDILAWINNPIDLFFLQIQGSGKVYLENGETINVHYHGNNGHQYRSIGKLLINDGEITPSDMSMQAIRHYLKNHPDKQRHVFNYNPSYVFFKLEEDGPLGCLSVPLTAGRSIATDQRLLPPGALGIIKTQKPIVDGNGKIYKWVNFSRFVLNQDSGGAIQGPGRVDIFWGNGPYAETVAGHLKHVGELYILIRKPRD